MIEDLKITVSIVERDIERAKAMVGKRLMRAIIQNDKLVSLEFEPGPHLVAGTALEGADPNTQQIAIEPAESIRGPAMDGLAGIERPEAERTAREEEARLIRLERASDDWLGAKSRTQNSS